MKESFRRTVMYAFQERIGCAQPRQPENNQCYNNQQMREILPNRQQIGQKDMWYCDPRYQHHPDNLKGIKNVFHQNESLFRRIMDVIPIGTKIETTTLNYGQRLPTVITLKQKFADGKDRHTIKSNHSDQNIRTSSSNFLATAGIIYFEPGNPKANLNPQKLFEHTGMNPTNQLDRQLLIGKQIRQGHSHGIRSMGRRDYTF